MVWTVHQVRRYWNPALFLRLHITNMDKCKTLSPSSCLFPEQTDYCALSCKNTHFESALSHIVGFVSSQAAVP